MRIQSGIINKMVKYCSTTNKVHTVPQARNRQEFFKLLQPKQLPYFQCRLLDTHLYATVNNIIKIAVFGT